MLNVDLMNQDNFNDLNFSTRLISAEKIDKDQCASFVYEKVMDDKTCLINGRVK